MTESILFTNPPWWGPREGLFFRSQWRAGVRAGSRWPFTHLAKSKPDRWAIGDYIPYPFFLGYAASYARRETGCEVTLRDSIALRESYDSYWKFLSAKRYDYIVFETATPSWEHDEKLIRRIHEIQPHANIAICGPITATNGESILENHPVKACIQGEYEKGVVKFVGGESGIIPYDLLTLEEMNAAPFPYFDPKHAYQYWDGLPPGQRYPQAQIWSSRGCPYRCIFCVWPATMTGVDPDGSGKRTVRQYSYDYMENFIYDLVSRFEFKSIYFDDDTFNLGDRHVQKICSIMEKVELPWSAMCRTDTISLETWKLMRDAGCFGVKLGFESGSQRVIDEIVFKKLDLEKAKAVVKEIQLLGMTVHGTFTYGLPGESPEEMVQTKLFIKDLGLDSVQESGCAVIEGTPLHSLENIGSLSRYRGATISEGFDSVSDGNLKLESIFKSKRSPGVLGKNRRSAK
jgi:radical SAM superfamily enzyme YgiQ (UPF0313 family)